MTHRSHRAGAARPSEPSPPPPAAGPGPVPPLVAGTAPVTLAQFQHLIRQMYLEKDLARGIDGTFMWLMEEVGELAASLRSGTHQQRLEEFADVLAWLATIANVADVDLAEAVMKKYGSGCPGCGQFLCVCANSEKP